MANLSTLERLSNEFDEEIKKVQAALEVRWATLNDIFELNKDEIEAENKEIMQILDNKLYAVKQEINDLTRYHYYCQHLEEDVKYIEDNLEIAEKLLK